MSRADVIKMFRLANEIDRRMARDDLISYAQRLDLDFHAAPHHRKIAKALEKVERGEITRLAVVAPPRSGKSTLVGKNFIPWYMSRNPLAEVIFCSHSGDISSGFGGMIRNMFSHPSHKEIFPEIELSRASRASDQFKLDNDIGTFIASGVNGPIVGRGAHIIVCDDLVKNREAADSARVREKTFAWWSADLSSRLIPIGMSRLDPPREPAIVYIQTRWHEDDLIGRLLKDDPSWTLLHFPAWNEKTKTALWPRTAADIERIRSDPSRRATDWNSLYQGDPHPEEGTFFKNSWLCHTTTTVIDKNIRENPRHYTFYMTSDFAVSEGRGDYTVHMIFGVDPRDRITLVDIYREQTTPDGWVDAAIKLIKKYRPVAWLQEQGQILKSVQSIINRSLNEAGVGVYQDPLTSATDKTSRARNIQAIIKRDTLSVPTNAPFYPDFLAEYIKFPFGKYDDQIDNLSLLGRRLDTLWAGKESGPPADPPGTLRWEDVKDGRREDSNRSSW